MTTHAGSGHSAFVKAFEAEYIRAPGSNTYLWPHSVPNPPGAPLVLASAEAISNCFETFVDGLMSVGYRGLGLRTKFTSVDPLKNSLVKFFQAQGWPDGSADPEAGSLVHLNEISMILNLLIEAMVKNPLPKPEVYALSGPAGWPQR